MADERDYAECDNCQRTEPDNTMIQLDDMGDYNVFCSYPCIVEFIQTALEGDLSYEGRMASLAEFTQRVANNLSRGEGTPDGD